MRAQSAFIKQLGSEITNGWVHPPGLRQEQSEILRNRFVIAQEMLQSGFFGAGRMAPFQRALELLRVANENDTVGRLRHGEYVSERHLAGFVDKEHINCLECFFRRPKPGRASKNIR